ncbi:glycosyltransferase family 2 protein [Winogradskyella aurantiaca]|uniref:glycosyltransferase family 2 protein n=1 Tax=Winogradskyella aurantiaca TaxID=2219558 RepID=UPI000E1D0B12|nr:glycosyltransferase family 2 protein [Winogradskyella aurantiaca]
MSKDLAVVIPVYNEKDNLEELIERIEATLNKITSSYEIIFVNDGSTDNSISVIHGISENKTKVFYVNLTRNYGHQVAVSAGLLYTNAKAVVIIDADLQDPPELIIELYAQFNQGFDVVNAKRKDRKGESLIKKGTAKLYYRLLKRLVSFEIPLDTGDYRLISRKVVDALNTMPEQNKYLRGQIAWLGFKTSSVLYERDSRKHGKSGYTYSKMFKLAIDGITGYSDRPLWLVSRMGFIIALLSFLFIIYAIFAYFVLEATITGWTSIIVSATFLGGIQLFSIGIIGEYIARINTNVKRRPLYMVESTNLESQKHKSLL